MVLDTQCSLVVLHLRVKGEHLRKRAKQQPARFLGLQFMLEPDITSLARAKWAIKLFYRPLHEGMWGEEGRA